MLNGGVDVVYNVAGPPGSHSQSGADSNKYAIGVDSDQNGLYPKNVIASMLKQIGNSIYDTPSRSKRERRRWARSRPMV